MNATQQISHSMAVSADITAGDIEAKVRELQHDEDEWDNLAVEVLDSGRFVGILQQCLANPDLAGLMLRKLVNEQWEQRAEDLLT